MNTEKMSDFFDNRATGYDNHMKTNVVDFEVFYNQVADPFTSTDKEVRLLDLGCGTGLELKQIFSKLPNAKVTAIDVSMEMLKLLQKKFIDKVDQLNLVCGSYLEYPLGQNYFDYAVSVMSMHHFLMDKKVELYQRILESLKPGAYYVEGDFIAEDNSEEEEYLKIYHKQKKKLEHNEIYHLDIPFTVKKQTKILLKAGFDEVTVTHTGLNQAVIVAKKEKEK